MGVMQGLRDSQVNLLVYSTLSGLLAQVSLNCGSFLTLNGRRLFLKKVEGFPTGNPSVA